MDISSKDFPGKIIAWAITIGAIILFFDVFLNMVDNSLTGFELVEDCLDQFWTFWDGGYYG